MHLPLHRGDRLAPHLGRVRGDHRADQRAGQLAGDDLGVEVGLRRAASKVAARLPFCGGEPSRRWNRRRRSWWMSSARLASSEKWLNARMTWLAPRTSRPASRCGELLAVDLGAADPERLDPGGLDEVEDVVAGLLADHLAQDPAEQPDVLAQRGVVGAAVRSDRRGAVRTAEVGDVDCGFGHAPSIRSRVGRSGPIRSARGRTRLRQPRSNSRSAEAASSSPAAAPSRNCSTAPSKSPRSASRTPRLWWQ